MGRRERGPTIVLFMHGMRHSVHLRASIELTVDIITCSYVCKFTFHLEDTRKPVLMLQLCFKRVHHSKVPFPLSHRKRWRGRGLEGPDYIEWKKGESQKVSVKLPIKALISYKSIARERKTQGITTEVYA